MVNKPGDMTYSLSTSFCLDRGDGLQTFGDIGNTFLVMFVKLCNYDN